MSIKQIKIILKLFKLQLNKLLAPTEQKHSRSRDYYFFYIKKYKSFQKYPACNLPEIDVVIPVIERDIEIVGLSIDSVRKFSLNTINVIFLIAPESARIKQLCKEKNCEYINENSLELPPKDSISYVVNNNDRSGWLFQQLLKLSGEQIAKSNYFLILDADTLLVRPQIFVKASKLHINCSDEYHTPYFEVVKKLLKIKKTFPLSFISHYMIFDVCLLKEMKEHITTVTDKKWYDAILDKCDYNNPSGFSEYETWGNYLYFFHKKKIVLDYWYNRSIAKNQLKSFEKVIKENEDQFKSVSFHWYKK